MSALPGRRRNRTMLAFSVGLLAVLMLPLLGWVAADALRSSKEGRDALAGLQPLIELPPTPTALVALLDDQDRVASLAVFVVAPPVEGVAEGGTVVVVPAGGDTTLPDGTRGRVGEAYRQGGVDALASSVEGLLGITFNSAVALDPEGLAAMLQGIGTIELNLDRAVIADGIGTGGPVEVFPPGPVVADAAGMAQLLSAWSSTESEVDRLPRFDAVWRAVADRIGSGLSLEPGSSSVGGAGALDPGVAGVVSDVFAGPMQVHTLSGTLVTDAAANPERLDLLFVNPGETTVVFATIAPNAVSPPYPTISIYVRSSLGDPALTRRAVETLILANANVVLVTENPESTAPARTSVAYVDDNDRQEAERFGKELGTFTSLQSEVRIDGIDAIVTLGESYRSEMAAGANNSSTTSTDAGTETSTG